ncbi:MAG TPA: GNAT family N-acetyltransferase [Solirubrobacterales bacterium]|nr:GNAT family N-acetyltransferase [Solirubrobacterales bacterium]
MRIREATAADSARAAELWTEAYTDQNPEEGRTEPYDEGELAAAAAAATVLVAESEPGEVVGIIALVPAAAPRGVVARRGEAELSRLAIAAQARGRGVGRALAEHVVGLAREEGAEKMALWSRPYQLEAHSLYESLGFRRTPERDERDPDGRRWVFTLALAAKR